MKAVILKPFAYSVDGLTSKNLERGAVVDIRDDIAAGLMAEGFIRKESAPAAVEHPAPAPHHAAHHAHEETRVGGDDLHVKHIGRGKFDLFLGHERLTHDAMTREEAEAALAAKRESAEGTN